ncbi:UNVERIFIED_ORG: hypothetical protein ABIB19_000991 [Arthrobacter sp. UYEF10]
MIAQDGLTPVIPGAVPRRRLGQTLRRERCTTAAPGLATGALDIYDRYFREATHPCW